MAPLKKVVAGSTEWACLEEAGEDEVGSFIASLDSPAEGEVFTTTISLTTNLSLR